jgi:flagellar hook-basal body complex protein FliE
MTPATVARAYQGLERLGSQSSAPAAASDEGGFGKLLSSALGSVAEKGRAAEASAAALISGKTDMVDVVTAVAETEVAMETLVTLRDRVISAYEEIMRMPI